VIVAVLSRTYCRANWDAAIDEGRARQMTNDTLSGDTIMKLILALVPALVIGVSLPAAAEDTAFIEGLSGSWAGEGTARRTADSDPVGVNCQFTSSAEAQSFSLDGTCRAMAIIRQNVSAQLTNTSGTSYEGIYTGPRGGQSALSGARNGNTLDLQVAWAQEVNGDSEARMQVEVPDPDSMIIRTIDTSPTTGAEVVTSEISLSRQ
jgi:hypothetical protein